MVLHLMKIQNSITYFCWLIHACVTVHLNLLSFLTPDRERRNPRHPEVGRARAPDFANIRPKVFYTFEILKYL